MFRALLRYLFLILHLQCEFGWISHVGWDRHLHDLTWASLGQSNGLLQLANHLTHENDLPGYSNAEKVLLQEMDSLVSEDRQLGSYLPPTTTGFTTTTFGDSGLTCSIVKCLLDCYSEDQLKYDSSHLRPYR